MDTVATLKGLRCPQCGSEDLEAKGKAGSLGKEVAGAFFGGAIAHMAMSRSASKNTETVPLAYVCKNCRHKFQSFPLAAQQEDILAAPCTISFMRLSSFVGALASHVVYLNGVNCGAVKNGATITLQTSNRWNTVFVTDQYGVAFKNVYRFEAVPGGTVSVKFKVGKFFE